MRTLNTTLALLCVAACSTAGEGPSSSLAQATEGDSYDPFASSSAGSVSESGSGTQPVTAGSASGPVFDAGVAGTSGGTLICDKLDILIAIDNSSTMLPYQQRLVAALPALLEAVRLNTDFADLHIMVVDSDERPTVGHCEVAECSPKYCEGYACMSWDALGLSRCDETLGAGVVAPYGGAASNSDCGLPKGRRYLQSTDVMLEDKLACISQVGHSGDESERPITSAVEAVTQPAVLKDCNGGFLRDDAPLMLLVLSDDPLTPAQDDALLGSPQGWYTELLAAKGNNPNAVAAIGIMPFGDVSCIPLEAETKTFVDFVSLFPLAALGSICADNYDAVLDQAALLAGEACAEFQG